MAGWDTSTWAGLSPNGLGQIKPNHYLEILKVVWRNRRELPFAWRILTRGVCDGCALGTSGIRDYTMEGVHLCLVRLDLLELNTMRALDHRRLHDVRDLRPMSSSDLRRLGRLAHPMIRRRGDAGFRRVTWEAAFEEVASRVRVMSPERLAFYLTSRGITNEAYYVAQKVARFLGTNSVDNSARICHAPSTVALKSALGVTASTCSYTDWLHSDLLVFFGSNVPNNQPVTTKYIYYAKKNGARVAVVNPYREPGLERYWIPSVTESALFGTRIADSFFRVNTGGDVAFLNGAARHILEQGWEDREFIQARTAGLDQLRSALADQSWEELESQSGAGREEMLRFARMVAEARTAVFVWSMGITQHRHGVENVRAIINLALLRGHVGRENTGLMPIRGHSGVQGGAEVGAVPWQFPGGESVNAESARRLGALYGFEVPDRRGLSAVEMIDAAHAGDVDLLYSIGGNFLETLPEPAYVREALENVAVRVHQDIVASPPMFLEPKDVVLLFPAQTRYEQRGGGTETSTERRILFSPEIPGRRIGESLPEWEIPMRMAEHVHPERAERIHFEDARAIREEIAKAVPFYEGIQRLKKQGDQVQWGGRILCRDSRFPTPDGRAHFTALALPGGALPEQKYLLSTRRGKQFNSMVLASRDPLTGAFRRDVFMNARDAASLGLRQGDAVRLRSEAGEFEGRCAIAPIMPRNVQVHWPEGNCLIPRGVRDPACGIPDYNTLVEVEPVSDPPTSAIRKR